MTARKVKISVSIDAALLADVDRYAASKHLSRSGALEQWLGQLSRKERLNHLEEETAAYYDSLTDAERREDAALAEASSRNAKKLDIDGASKSPSRKSPR